LIDKPTGRHDTKRKGVLRCLLIDKPTGRHDTKRKGVLRRLLIDKPLDDIQKIEQV
jgi:hypothetical protein